MRALEWLTVVVSAPGDLNGLVLLLLPHLQSHAGLVGHQAGGGARTAEPSIEKVIWSEVLRHLAITAKQYQPENYKKIKTEKLV